tara:strand:+ start:356 stop:637 length:282 start_codon:yes stop_codon:yes gene_type:complete
MPYGKGTYGDKVGRPPKKKKGKGMPMRKDMAYWSSKADTSPTKMFGSDNTMKNDVSTSGQPENNMQLIEALKKEDEVKKEVETLKGNSSNKLA